MPLRCVPLAHSKNCADGKKIWLKQFYLVSKNFRLKISKIVVLSVSMKLVI